MNLLKRIRWSIVLFVLVGGILFYEYSIRIDKIYFSEKKIDVQINRKYPIRIFYDIKGNAVLYGIDHNNRKIFPILREGAEYLDVAIFKVPIDSLVIEGKGEFVFVLYKIDRFYSRYLNYLLDHFFFVLVGSLFIFIFFRYNYKIYFIKIIKFVLGMLVLLIFNFLFIKLRFFNSFFNMLLFLINVIYIGGGVYLLLINENMGFDIKCTKKNKYLDYLVVFLLWFLYSIYYLYLDFPHIRALRIMDTFHVGEVLVQYMGLNQGLSFYKDIFTVHGMFSDAYIAKFSFMLFGNNIRSYYLGSYMLSFITMLFMLIFIYNILGREIFIWFFIGVFVLGFKNYYFTDKYFLLYIVWLLGYKEKNILYLAMFILFPVALLYSLEVGASVGVFVLIYGLLKKDISRSFLIVGWGISFVLFLVFIKFHLFEFWGLIKYVISDYNRVFFQIYPFPNILDICQKGIFPIIVWGTIFVFLLFRVRLYGVEKNAYYISIMLSSFIAFLPAINRMDVFSLGVRMLPPILSLFIILKGLKRKIIIGVVFLLGFVYPFPQYNMANNIDIIKKTGYNMGMISYIVQNKNTDKYLTKDYYECYEYLQHKKVKLLYSLSSEGIWYYMLNSPYYTKYMLPIFAHSEREQKDVIDALKKNKVSHIIYNKHIWSFYPEGKPFKVSRKLIYDYIEDNYEVSDTFGDIVIMKRE